MFLSHLPFHSADIVLVMWEVMRMGSKIWNLYYRDGSVEQEEGVGWVSTQRLEFGVVEGGHRYL